MEENDKCWYECKKHQAYEKHYVWNPVTRSCEYGKYLASIVDDSAITCDEVIESHDEKTITIPTNFNEKKTASKTQTFTFIFISYYSIIDNCYYLRLLDKVSSKTKAFIIKSLHR